MRGQLKAKAKANGFSLHHYRRRGRVNGRYRYWLENEDHQIVATGFLLDEMHRLIDLAVEQRERNAEWERAHG